MVDKNNKIEEILKDIKRKERTKTYDSYSLIGGYYLNLYKIRKDEKDLDEAIKSYTEAMKYQPEMAEVYVNRANIYVIKNDNESAVQDFAKASELRKKNHGDALDDFYLDNHLSSLSQLQGIKDTISNLKQKGQMDPEFLESYEQLTDNVLKLNNRMYALEVKNDEQAKQIKELMEKMEQMSIEMKSNNKSDDEVKKLKEEISTLTLKLNEVSINVEMIMS